MEERQATAKKNEVIKKKGDRWVADWKCLPSSIMAEFQDSQEDPRVVYRELKQLLVKHPQKASHEQVIELFDRYKEALPKTKAMIPIRTILDKKKETLRLLVDQPEYTKHVLLEVAGTVLNEADGALVDDILNNKNIQYLKDYAVEKVQRKFTSLTKLTTASMEEQLIPLPPNNRKRQLLHHFVVNDKRVPAEMIKRRKPADQKGRGGGRGRNGRGGGRGGHQGRNDQDGNKQTNNTQNGKNGNNGRGRGRGGGRGRGNGNRGGRAPNAVTETNTIPNEENKSESNVFQKAYDFSKIPAKLPHFGQVTPDMHALLQAQLLDRNMPIVPKQ